MREFEREVEDAIRHRLDVIHRDLRFPEAVRDRYGLIAVELAPYVAAALNSGAGARYMAVPSSRKAALTALRGHDA